MSKETGKCPVTGSSTTSESGCPMKFGSNNEKSSSNGNLESTMNSNIPSECPMSASNNDALVEKRNGCPVSPNNIYKWFTGTDFTKSKEEQGGKVYKHPEQYNVSASLYYFIIVYFIFYMC